MSSMRILTSNLQCERGSLTQMLENWDDVIHAGHEAMTRKIPNDKLPLVTRISRFVVCLVSQNNSNNLVHYN